MPKSPPPPAIRVCPLCRRPHPGLSCKGYRAKVRLVRAIHADRARQMLGACPVGAGGKVVIQETRLPPVNGTDLGPEAGSTTGAVPVAARAGTEA